MDASLKELRTGKKVLCVKCKKAYMQSMHGVDASKEHDFICPECGDKVSFITRMPKGWLNW